jgi:hypothetical protein
MLESGWGGAGEQEVWEDQGQGPSAYSTCSAAFLRAEPTFWAVLGLHEVVAIDFNGIENKLFTGYSQCFSVLHEDYRKILYFEHWLQPKKWKRAVPKEETQPYILRSGSRIVQTLLASRLTLTIPLAKSFVGTSSLSNFCYPADLGWAAQRVCPEQPAQISFSLHNTCLLPCYPVYL